MRGKGSSILGRLWHTLAIRINWRYPNVIRAAVIEYFTDTFHVNDENNLTNLKEIQKNV